MIRLIKTSDLSLHEFEGRSIPGYAILSHRWEDGEVTLQEMHGDLHRNKPGWLKLQQFCAYAREKGHQYVWMDTCCIDKTSSAELSEAINSMFNWYRRAQRCYAYLNDVPIRGGRTHTEWMEIFKGSVYFTRGWTLQELLAPKELTFVCHKWEQEIGTRATLSHAVESATKIPAGILLDTWSLKDEFGGFYHSIADIMSWASERRTTRVEDMAYSLMGLFRINMPLLYGEGQNAFIRLQLEIMSKYDDNSLFAWNLPLSNGYGGGIWKINRSLDIPDSYWWGGLLAPAVQCFRSCTGYSFQLEKFEDGRLFTMTNRGIQVEGLLRRYDKNHHGRKRWLLPLNCGANELLTNRLGIVLEGDIGGNSQLAMRVVNTLGIDSDLIVYDYDAEKKLRAEYEHVKIFVPQAWPGDFDFPPT